MTNWHILMIIKKNCGFKTVLTNLFNKMQGYDTVAPTLQFAMNLQA